MMEVALPMAAGMDCYEDMFKEITRKLYGEEGLPENMGEGGDMHCHPDYENDANGDGHGGALTAFGLAALMQNGFPPHPGMLRMDHIQEAKYRSSLHGSIMQGPCSTAEDKWISSEEVLQWTGSQIASYNPSQKLFRCADCECVGFLSRVAEHWLGTHANLRVFQCPQCPYASAWARCVRMHLTRQHDIADPPGDAAALYKENPVLEEVTKYLQRLKTKVETRAAHTKTVVPAPVPDPATKPQILVPPVAARNTAATPSNTDSAAKRYCCGYCPYATDRRDLFTRHENIHREEKPFQCYVCEKQFNRADHVKKHFLRMHRDYPYDLNRIRRQPPKNASGMSYYHKYNTPPSNSENSNNRAAQDTPNHVHDGAAPAPPMHQVPHHLNIPGGFSSNLGPRMPASIDQPKQNKSAHNGCNAKSHGSKTKRKGDKRFSCCYCSWSGVDNWCLKRHLNTHLKPFVCGLCDYKAARSERLATHVLKVHNKKPCSRCSFLADDQVQLGVHLQEHHVPSGAPSRCVYFTPDTLPPLLDDCSPLDHRTNNIPRTGGFPSHPTTPMASSFGLAHGAMGHHYQPKREPYEYNMLNQRAYPPSPVKMKQQYGGAARLFHYLEVSDTSEPEDEAPHHVVGSFLGGEQEEPPPFVCQECGCEFVDDTSLETHTFTHHSVKTSTVNIEEKKTSNNTQLLYECSVCKTSLSTQASIMEHMRTHSRLSEHSNSFARCNSGMPSDHELSMQKMSNNVVRCPHCVFTFQLGPDLDHHLRQHHDVDMPCATCEASLDRALRMRTSGNARAYFDEARTVHSPSPSQSSRDDLKRSRKQRQPRKVVSETSDSEIQVLRRPGFMKRRNAATKRVVYPVEMSQLVDKYTRFLLARKRLKCSWCRPEMTSLPYHTPVSLALHRLWRHTKNKFQCEHCDKRYRHQYQVVLHSSREHVTIHRAPAGPSVSAHSVPSDIITTVPESIIKEPIILLDSSVPAKLSSPSFQTINCLSVPGVSTLHTNYQTGLNLPKHFPLLESYPKHHIAMQQPHMPSHSSSPLHQQITLLVPTLPMP